MMLLHGLLTIVLGVRKDCVTLSCAMLKDSKLVRNSVQFVPSLPNAHTPFYNLVVIHIRKRNPYPSIDIFIHIPARSIFSMQNNPLQRLPRSAIFSAGFLKIANAVLSSSLLSLLKKS